MSIFNDQNTNCSRFLSTRDAGSASRSSSPSNKPGSTSLTDQSTRCGTMSRHIREFSATAVNYGGWADMNRFEFVRSTSRTFTLNLKA
eukprot:1328987-Amorphochlora_amoeboformis.AAC.1